MHAPVIHHNRRFYIFMTTVVVGAILILMIINDNGQFDLLTSASVALDESQGVEFNEEKGTYMIRENDIALKIESNTIPIIQEDGIGAQAITIESRDVNNKININQEELEVKNLDQITLNIDGFLGKIDFDDFTLSLHGEANKISVNGVTISTKGRIKLYFNGLSYDSIDVQGIQLTSTALRSTDGSLIVPGRLDYGLEDDDIQLTNFQGDFSIGSGKESYVILDGKVKGFSVSGGLTMEVN